MFSFLLWFIRAVFVNSFFVLVGVFLTILALLVGLALFNHHFNHLRATEEAVKAVEVRETLAKSHPDYQILGWAKVRKGAVHSKKKSTGSISISSTPNTSEVHLETPDAATAKPAAGSTLTSTYASMFQRSLASVRSGSSSPGSAPSPTTSTTPAPNSNSSNLEERWFLAIKHGKILYFYRDEKMEETGPIYLLSETSVHMSRGDAAEDEAAGTGEKAEGERADERESQFFNKKKTILLKPLKRDVLNVLSKDMDDGVMGKTPEERTEKGKKREGEKAPIYLSCGVPTLMEDWYWALLAGSGTHATALDKDESSSASYNQVFSEAAYQKHIDRVNSLVMDPTTRALNFKFGRIFLGLSETSAIEGMITEKIMKKIRQAKATLPSWVPDIEVKEIILGTNVPIFSNVAPKEAVSSGLTVNEASVHFEGEVRIVLRTTSRPVAQLALVIKSLKGNVRVVIKPAPSNRIWWCFTEMPEMDVTLAPLFGGVGLSVISETLLKLAKKGMAEAIVYPAMDDVPFFDTVNMVMRGGIFNEAARHNGPGKLPVTGAVGNEGIEAIPMNGTAKGKDAKSTHRSDSSASAELTDKKLSRAETMPAAAQPATGLAGYMTSTRSLLAGSARRSDSPDGGMADTAAHVTSGESVERVSSAPAPVGFKSVGSSHNESPLANATTIEGLPNVEDTLKHSASATTLPNPDLDGAAVDSSRSTSTSPSRSSIASDPLASRSGHRASSSIGQDGGIYNSVPAPSTSSFGSGSTSTLIGTFRSRMANKEPLQASAVMSSARDKYRKWAGIKGESGDSVAESVENDSQRKSIDGGRKLWESSFMQRGRSPSTSSATKPIEIQKSTGTLQQRLAAAAQQGIASRSVDSAPASSPDSGNPAVIHGSPEVHIANGLGRRTSNASDASASSAPIMRLSMEEQSRPSIRSQPGSSNGMVVPRVPKRPNSIMAIASSPPTHDDSLFTSGAATPVAKPPLPARAPVTSAVSSPPPALPPRKSHSPDSTGTDSVLDSHSSSTPTPTNMSAASSPAKSLLILRPGRRRTASLRTLPDGDGKEVDVMGTEQVMGVHSSSVVSTAEDALKQMIALDDKAAAASEGS